ncbi:MAG: hypothetical protein ABI629_20875 [bacterium]
MLRRFATVLLVLAVALGGLTSAACAGGRCTMLQQQRMRCCEDGIHAERSCCGPVAQRAGAQAPATFERQAQPVTQTALALLPLALGTVVADRGPIAAAPIPISHAPPTTLIAQHTSLLL